MSDTQKELTKLEKDATQLREALDDWKQEAAIQLKDYDKWLREALDDLKRELARTIESC